MEREIRHISELPDNIAELLYELRPETDLHTMKKDFISRYGFVLVDGKVAYASVKDDWKVKMWLDGHGMKCLTLPDAVIADGKLIKNRYGYAAH
ncbi:MAG: hypothetical protein J6X18_00035 [Bacteroidales bacterium]|nr:hypothetical protein [Bacteroidales bacterium]